VSTLRLGPVRSDRERTHAQPRWLEGDDASGSQDVLEARKVGEYRLGEVLRTSAAAASEEHHRGTCRRAQRKQCPEISICGDDDGLLTHRRVEDRPIVGVLQAVVADVRSLVTVLAQDGGEGG
jgi:hypothetical protein